MSAPHRHSPRYAEGAMAADLLGGHVETDSPAFLNGTGPILARRIWLIASEGLPLGVSTPMLTGLYGYPWRSSRMDARCTATSPLRRDFVLPPRLERHHPVVPDVECSCGIYALRDEPGVRVALRSPVGVPTATGFVELDGRILGGRTTFRAQRTTIVGPLTLQPGRPPIVGRLFRRSLHPQRVALVGSEYQVRWSTRPTGQAWHDWANETARSLRERYQLEVVF